MQKEFLIWSDGHKHDKEGIFRKKAYQVVQEFPKREIENIYCMDDCVIYIVQGEMYKEGIFNWEKSELNQANKTVPKGRHLVKLKSNNMDVNEFVLDLSIGENHVLIRTVQGNVYAWGDNYYGQLGLGNLMMPKILEPQLIKFSCSIEHIYTYKNNSFAIDTEKKLWVWGKNDYLGSNFNANLFKPTQILSQYKMENFKINNDRIIINVSTKSAIAENDDDAAEIEDEEKEFLAELAREELEKKTKGGGKYERKENKDKSVKSETVPIFDKAKNDKADKAPDKGSSTVMFVVKKLNDDVTDILSKLAEDDKTLLDIRNKVLSDQTSIKKNGLDQMWDSIILILSQTEKLNKQKDSTSILTITDTIEVFNSVINSMITGSFNQMDVNSVIDNFAIYEKEINKIISNLKSDDMIKDDSIAKFTENLKVLLTYFLKYKKIEILIHKMSAHQFLLKSFRFKNVMEALELIVDKDDNIVRKLALIEKSFDNLRFLIEKTNGSFHGIENVYGTLSLMNIQNDSNDVEKFLHKHVIESTFYIRDLWKLLIGHVEEAKKSKEKEAQLIKVLDKYKELYAIQMYINSISIKNIFYDDKKKVVVKKKADIDIVTVKNKIALLLTEIDGAITRIESFLNEKLDITKHSTDVFSNVK